MISQEDVPHSANQSPSLSSLPHEIVVSCLAHVSGSYYPILCLVSKQFRSIILSDELYEARSQLGTKETRLFVFLKLPTRSNPCWFTLWIKPNQTLTNGGTIKKKSTGNLLVPLPSLYNYQVPIPCVTVGSETYIIGGYDAPSSSVWVYRNRSLHTLRKAPSMSMARNNAVVAGIYPKIYVMGGCASDESMNWAEVFDVKTQTWEPLPDPGPEARGHWVRKIQIHQENIYLCSEKKYYIYDSQEGRWDVKDKVVLNYSMCLIDKVRYIYHNKKCWWLDTKSKYWRMIRGVDFLNKFGETDRVEIVNFAGKLVMVWDRFTLSKRNKKIWCAMIALEKCRGGDEVWGKIEWVDDVLMVPLSYTFLDCMAVSI
ncbi:PREDICTED: putative F-box/kelch-repeat protein At4g39760 [Camelina sativa]|uniref:F-box/kelch-repeat protein At4g39760 n=1 Tax=Camelina sativa TaxID=90675 RepID=A0ABM0V5D0_CAMSA|nr:PREDICTED: putative F-box/kelch-repeat protein At4g39760 [Camelina sativa]